MEDITALFDAAAKAALHDKRMAHTKRSTFKTKDKEDTAVPVFSFLDPAQWTRARGIALIHADSETLLGNFSEYIHRTGARKLIREASPIAVSAVERVSGSWWLGEHRIITPRAEWHETRRIYVHLHLVELGLRSPAVEVLVALEYGGIARVELVEETKFAGEDSLVFLPAGTDILASCDLDTKLNVRKGCGL